MKFSLTAILLILSSTAFSQPDRQYTSLSARRAFYLKLSQQHADPATQEIFAKAPVEFFDQYVDGKTEQDLLDSYGTVIHELLHSYNGSTSQTGHSFFIQPGKWIHLEFGKYYNAKELNSWVRKSAQDSILRYGLYVGGESAIMGKEVDLNRGEGSEVMSVVMGVYGLVEEFDAYYHGLLAKSALEGHYRQTPGYDEDKWKSDYAGQLQQSMVPYHEFRLFIAWYLRYAQLKHKDIYQDIQSNKALRSAFTVVDQRYGKLVKSVEAQVAGLQAGGGMGDAMAGLDFDGSEDDFYKFCEAAGIERKYLYKEEVVVENGKKMIRKKALMDADDLQELRTAYDEMVNQYKAITQSVGGANLANVPAQIAYLERLLIPDLREILDAFRLTE